MDPEAFLDVANQVVKLKMFPYFDIAHCTLCALSVREDLGTGECTRGSSGAPPPPRGIFIGGRAAETRERRRSDKLGFIIKIEGVLSLLVVSQKRRVWLRNGW